MSTTSLTKERKELKSLLGSNDKQWKRIGDEIKEVKERFGQKTELGRRRTRFEEAPEGAEVELAEVLIEKEPITVVLSEKGWIRSLRGHQTALDSLQFKEGDRLKRAVLRPDHRHAAALCHQWPLLFRSPPTSCPAAAALASRSASCSTWRRRPTRSSSWSHVPERKLLVASTSGHGFVVAEDEVVAMTRKGKQVLNVPADEEAIACAPVEGDSVAVIGENRKLLLFPLKELPEMPRGKGVRLQRYKQGGLADAKIFTKKEGLTWIDSAGRTFTHTELRDWWGARAQAGRLPPKGFPKSNNFGPKF